VTRGEIPPEPTPGELRVLRAYLEAGTCRDAARLLGVHEQTVKRRLANARSRVGVDTNAQLVLALAQTLRT
jgi:DNA-binding NarL/FixJ family response regulator